jgi:hypothetical protein
MQSQALSRSAFQEFTRNSTEFVELLVATTTLFELTAVHWIQVMSIAAVAVPSIQIRIPNRVMTDHFANESFEFQELHLNLFELV